TLAAHVAVVDVFAFVGIAAADGVAVAAGVAVVDVVAGGPRCFLQQCAAIAPGIAVVDIAAIPAVAALHGLADAPQVAVVNVVAVGVAGLGGQRREGGEQEPEEMAHGLSLMAGVAGETSQIGRAHV